MVRFATLDSDDRREMDHSAWTCFAATRCADQRDQLVLRYLPLLLGAATRMSRQMPAVERQDAISNGFFGLAQAVERFEPARGLSFTTFAFPRIRGAILDAVRSESPVPRQTRERQRSVALAERRLGAEHHREPTRSEVAEELGIPVAEFWGWHDQQLRGRDTSLDVPLPAEVESPRVSASQLIPDPAGLEFSEQIEAESERHRIQRLVASLPPRERTAVEDRFYHERSYAEIGRKLGVSTSRACEIVQTGLARLRAAMVRNEVVCTRRAG